MTDTRLNLVAIAIFALTLSALVSPVIHISPAIPAVLTLGGLTLITADQLRWGGRGTDFFVALFQSQAERQRVVCHEAGHFLAAYCLEIPITDYSLSAWEVLKQGESGLAGVQFDTSQLQDQCRAWRTRPQALERWATVWMAGIAAEKLIYGESFGGDGDRQQLRSAFRQAGLPDINLSQKGKLGLFTGSRSIGEICGCPSTATASPRRTSLYPGMLSMPPAGNCSD